MWAWVIKLIGGWLPTGTKPFGEYIGKIIWVVGIILVCLIVYNRFTKPTEHQVVQSGGQAFHQTNAPKATFGCVSLKVYEYYHKEKPEVKK